jgi:hypothetical protein
MYSPDGSSELRPCVAAIPPELGVFTSGGDRTPDSCTFAQVHQSVLYDASDPTNALLALRYHEEATLEFWMRWSGADLPTLTQVGLSE